jgi:hypothetical protein
MTNDDYGNYIFDNAADHARLTYSQVPEDYSDLNECIMFHEAYWQQAGFDPHKPLAADKLFGKEDQ